jgi:hypothetical protein
MSAERAYARKVSPTEAREGHVMVTANKLSLFPPAWRPFQLRQGDQTREAVLEAEECTCRGPQNPHEHYYVSVPDLRPGDRVTIRKDADEEGLYHLEVARS